MHVTIQVVNYPFFISHPSIYSDFEYKQKFNMLFSLPGHAPLLQLSDSVELPEQSLPPPKGVGSLHNRVLDLKPSPQVTEHES